MDLNMCINVGIISLLLHVPICLGLYDFAGCAVRYVRYASIAHHRSPWSIYLLHLVSSECTVISCITICRTTDDVCFAFRDWLIQLAGIGIYICVRVSRRWHYRKGRDNGLIDHTDLVQLDEQVFLHLTMNQILSLSFAALLLQFAHGIASAVLTCALSLQGNHMYAEIGVDHVRRFEPLLEEGKVYELRKFIVASPKSAFKPVQITYMIWFMKYTTIQEQFDVPHTFPLWTYNPIPFTNLPNPSNTWVFYWCVLHDYHARCNAF